MNSTTRGIRTAGLTGRTGGRRAALAGAAVAAVLTATLQLGAGTAAHASMWSPTQTNALPDVTPLALAATEADAALAAQRAAILTTITADSATATEATTQAGDRVDAAMVAMDAALPLGVTGPLRDAVVKLHADLAARRWNQRFATTGFVYHRVPQPEFEGADDLGALRRRLDFAAPLAGVVTHDVDVVLDVASRTSPVRPAGSDTVRGLETLLQLAAADGTGLGCSGQGLAPEYWAGHHLVVTWAKTSRTERTGTLTVPGRAGSAGFTALSSGGVWDSTMVDTCAVLDRLN